MKWLLFLNLLFIAPWGIAQEPLKNISVLALSPVDGQAIVKLPNKTMQVLEVGDSIDGTRISLKQVLVDKAVFVEEIQSSGQHALETVWLHKARNGVSRVERIKSTPPERAPRVVNQLIEPRSTE